MTRARLKCSVDFLTEICQLNRQLLAAVLSIRVNLIDHGDHFTLQHFHVLRRGCVPAEILQGTFSSLDFVAANQMLWSLREIDETQQEYDRQYDEDV